MMRKFLPLILLLLTTQLSQAQDTIVDKYLPAIDNWSETSREMYFADDLFFLINGGAELYLEYGFDQVVSSEMINEDGQKAVIELYKMKDPEAAHGIYSFNAKNGDVTGIAAESIQGKDYLMFRKADVYGIIRMKEEAGETMKALAKSTADNIPLADTLSEFINSFEDIQDYRKIYIEGNIALNNFYYFGHNNIFRLQSAMVLEKPDHKIIVIDYPSSDERSLAFNEAKESLLSSDKFELQKEGEQNLKIRDRKDEFIEVISYKNFLIISVSPDGNEEEIHYIKLLL